MKRLLLLSAFALGLCGVARAADYPPEVAVYNAAHPEEVTADGKAKLGSHVIEDAGNWYCSDEGSTNGPFLNCETRSAIPRIMIAPTQAYSLGFTIWFPTPWGGDDDIQWQGLEFSNGSRLKADGGYIKKEQMPAFIHAFTASSSVTLVATNGRQWTIPLAGSSAVISTISLWAKEHNIPLPPPFTPPEQAILEPDSTISLRIPKAWQLAPSLSQRGATGAGAPVDVEPMPTAPNKEEGQAPQGGSNDQSSTGGGCQNDWRACRDNTDLVEHWSGFSRAQAACIVKGKEIARYGTPHWGDGSWLSGAPFSSYVGGDTAPKTGFLALEEPKARFQNQYGATVNRKADCAYNLKQEKIITFFLQPEDGATGGEYGEELIAPYDDKTARLDVPN